MNPSVGLIEKGCELNIIAIGDEIADDLDAVTSHIHYRAPACAVHIPKPIAVRPRYASRVTAPTISIPTPRF